MLRLETAAPDRRIAIATGIATPAGLAGGGDDLYVADRDAGRVVQIVDGGNVLSPAREVARGLAGPGGHRARRRRHCSTWSRPTPIA